MSNIILDEAVVLAAGRGKRLNSDYSSILPKSLVPVDDVPIINYVLNTLKKFKISKIYLVVGYKKNLIMSYIKQNSEKEQITFIQQKKLSGIADAVLLSQDYIKGKYFVTILGDSILDLENVNEFYTILDKYAPIAIEGVTKDKKEAIMRACEVSFDRDYKIKYCKEKPSSPRSDYRGIGFYIFSREIFKSLRQTPISNVRNERELSDTINIIARQGKAYAAEIKGKDFNINTKEDLYRSRTWIAEKYSSGKKFFLHED